MGAEGFATLCEELEQHAHKGMSHGRACHLQNIKKELEKVQATMHGQLLASESNPYSSSLPKALRAILIFNPLQVAGDR